MHPGGNLRKLGPQVKRKDRKGRPGTPQALVCTTGTQGLVPFGSDLSRLGAGQGRRVCVSDQLPGGTDCLTHTHGGGEVFLVTR